MSLLVELYRLFIGLDYPMLSCIIWFIKQHFKPHF